MKKRLTVELSEEAAKVFDSALEVANKDFQYGKIHPSVLLSEMVLSANVDVEALRLKSTDLRKYLSVMSEQADIDFESAFASLKKLRSRVSKLKSGEASEEDV